MIAIGDLHYDDRAHRVTWPAKTFNRTPLAPEPIDTDEHMRRHNNARARLLMQRIDCSFEDARRYLGLEGR